MAQVEELHLWHGIRLVESFRPVAQVGHGVHIDGLAEVHATHIE